MITVVAGPAGSGKSTVGRMLADRLGVPFCEGDALHPRANVEKMAAGAPLTDADRLPWLEAVAGWIDGEREAGHDAVVACSALRRRYRDLVRAGHDDVWFVLLEVPPDELLARVSRRGHHFMPPELVDSQLVTLEPLQPDEWGITVSGTPTPSDIVAQLVASAPG